MTATRMGIEAASPIHREATVATHREAVVRVIARMRQDLSGPLDLDGMARIARLSRFHFLRVFEAVTGVSPARFLAALRIERARSLLLETTLPVTVITFEIGYSSLGTFSRTFGELVGLSPNRFRQLHRLLTTWRPDQLFAQHWASPATSCPTGYQIIGTVRDGVPISSVIFLGIFPSRVPSRVPVAGMVLTSPGPFALQWTQPKSPAYLLAAGINGPIDSAADLLTPDQQRLRVGAEAIPVTAGDSVEIGVQLRPLSDVDPPILVALPSLLLR